MPTGYCPHCQQNVLATREQMDTCLAVILLIFTAGIGLFIYLIIHFSKPENKCIHCTTIVQFDQSSTPEQLSYRQPAQLPQNNMRNEEITQVQTEMAAYCPLCGERIGNSSDKFCPNCGNQI